MKENLLKENIVIADKITNEFLLVKSVGIGAFKAIPLRNEGGASPKVLCVGDNLDALTKLEPELISKDDLILYRFIMDVQKPEVPDINKFSLKDGILLREGAAVTEQGERRLSKILGAAKNSLVFEDVNGDIVLYNLRRDKFSLLLRSLEFEDEYGNSLTSDLVVAQAEKPFIAFINVYKVEQQNKDGETGKTKVYEESHCIAERTFDDSGALATVPFRYGEINDITVNNGIILTNYLDKDENVRKTAVSSGDDLFRYFVAGTGKSAKYVNEYLTVQLEDGKIAVWTPEGIQETYDIPELRGFYAVDRGRDSNLFFVNDARKIKRLIAKPTFDRGTIYTVEAVN